MGLLLLLGRIILGGFFINSGINHFIGYGTMTQYAKMKGVPFPAFSQGAAGMMLVLGGLSIVSGFHPLAGILMLVAFLVPVSLVMHNFWSLEDPQARMADKVNFLKNMALLGALLMLLTLPFPWPLSLTP